MEIIEMQNDEKEVSYRKASFLEEFQINHPALFYSVLFVMAILVIIMGVLICR